MSAHNDRVRNIHCHHHPTKLLSQIVEIRTRRDIKKVPETLKRLVPCNIRRHSKSKLIARFVPITVLPNIAVSALDLEKTIEERLFIPTQDLDYFKLTTVKWQSKTTVNKPYVLYGRGRQLYYGQIRPTTIEIIISWFPCALKLEIGVALVTKKFSTATKSARLNVGTVWVAQTNDCTQMYHEKTPQKRDTLTSNTKTQKDKLNTNE